VKTINFRKDFSPYPGMRYRTSGWFSAEEFRDDFLIPALKEHGVVCLELDGLSWSYPPYFLEEVFGGAIRKGIKLDHNVLKLVSEDDYLKQEIWWYINKALGLCDGLYPEFTPKKAQPAGLWGRYLENLRRILMIS